MFLIEEKTVEGGLCALIRRVVSVDGGYAILLRNVRGPLKGHLVKRNPTFVHERHTCRLETATAIGEKEKPITTKEVIVLILYIVSDVVSDPLVSFSETI